MDLILLEQIVKRRPTDAQQLCSVRDIALCACNRSPDGVPVGSLACCFQVQYAIIVVDQIELQIIDRVRTVRKFESKDALLAQLSTDIATVLQLVK